MTGPLTGLRIGLVTASASRFGGGVFEAVVAHTKMLRTLGCEPSIFALRDVHSETDKARFEGAPVHLADVLGPRQIGFAPELDRALQTARLDCLHLHGIWMYPSAAASRWAHRTGRPYFISPHGMLDGWITARGRWKKALARSVYERANWRRASALHALTSREATDIARESARQDSVVIPNAGPAPLAAGVREMPRPVCVYIGRIHRKKNLVALVRAWHAARRPADARLIVAGWGDDEAIAKLRAEIDAGDKTVDFVGPVFGEEKDKILRAARFVILPSHSEGLPMAMLEAWASGVPTIMTAECNLPEGFSAKAALECGYDAPAIATCLESALMLDWADWSQMSAASLKLARTRFSTEAVAECWANIYLNAAVGEAPQ